MPRRRMIDPEIWGDKWFGGLDYFEQIFFVGIISNCDDEGRVLADPVYLRSRIFIYKDVAVDEINVMLDKFTKTNPNFHLYNVNGNQYISLLKWGEYQKPDHAKPSKIPPPPDIDSGETNSPNESPNGSGNDSLLGQSSLVKSSLVKSSIVKDSIVGFAELIGDEKKLTDRLTTTLKEFRPRGWPHVMHYVIKPLFKDAGLDEPHDKEFEFLSHLLKLDDKIAIQVLVKTARFGKNKKNLYNYMMRILEEKEEAEVQK